MEYLKRNLIDGSLRAINSKREKVCYSDASFANIEDEGTKIGCVGLIKGCVEGTLM